MLDGVRHGLLDRVDRDEPVDVAFLAANTPTVVTTSAVAWGIETGWNTTSTGTVTVEALTTGGWASTTVSYPWEISFNILGGASASCG